MKKKTLSKVALKKKIKAANEFKILYAVNIVAIALTVYAVIGVEILFLIFTVSILLFFKIIG